jgi:hypothetical protein
MSARFLMTNDQAAFFEGWFKYALNDGANWFVMPIKTPMGLIDHEVHIKETGKPVKALGNRLWQVDIEILLRFRQVVTEEVTVNSSVDLKKFVSLLDDEMKDYKA